MKKKNTQLMQKQINYKDVVYEIKNFFAQKILSCIKSGIKKHRILIDPGFGFGKNIYHNYKILANLNQFNIFKLPILVGMSRKSMISNLLKINQKDTLIGSISCAIIAAMQGVKIIRVHDVKKTCEAIKIINTIMKLKNS